MIHRTRSLPDHNVRILRGNVPMLPGLCLRVTCLVLIGSYCFASPPASAAEEAADAEDAEDAKVFRAGAAASNITPWLGVSLAGSMASRTSDYVHDELHARCLALDDGKTKLAIVLCDNCLIPREVFDQAKALAHKATGIPIANMLMAATHTHSAPTTTSVFQNDPSEEYNRYLVRKIADAVRRADRNLEPAKIGWGAGQVPGQVFNRRWKMKQGKIPPGPFGAAVDLVRMNPPRASEDLIEPAGPTDPQVPVVSVQSASGRPIALLANYSLHYVGGTGGVHISADYFGMFADRIQKLLDADRLDPPFVGILSNGTSGDINNINFRQKSKPKKAYEQMRIVANDVAAEAYHVAQLIQYREWVSLDAAVSTLELGVRRPSPGDLEKAKAILAKAKGPALRGLPEIYASETVRLSEYPETVEIILQALRIGDLAITAIPCEVFVEIGLELKAKSPDRPTFTIELANGYNGYLPTVKHHELGGYETWRARSSYLEAQGAPKIVNTLLRLLEKVRAN